MARGSGVVARRIICTGETYKAVVKMTLAKGHDLAMGVAEPMAPRGRSCYPLPMTKLEQIERAIAALSDEEQAKLEKWWSRFRNERWDRRIADDYDAGRLDDLIAEARAEIAAGKTQPFEA